MVLPLPLFKIVVKFLPLPDLWVKRLCLLTKRCAVDANVALESGFDLMDEILEEGGLLQAFDQAGVRPPKENISWVS